MALALLWGCSLPPELFITITTSPADSNIMQHELDNKKTRS
uniref:Uncharacterized protein n=1 Tax=Rhizophora mucronata TaxID=61149 RepID=A0A2P2Q842_RHIMU